MNETLSQALAKEFNVTVEYAKANLPQLVDDFLHWHTIALTIGCICMILLICIAIISITLTLKSKDKKGIIHNFYWDEYKDITIGNMLLNMSLMIIGIIAVIALITNIICLIEIYNYPNIYILDWLRDTTV